MGHKQGFDLAVPAIKLMQKQSGTTHALQGFLNRTPINFMVDFDVAIFYDSNLGLYHGICYSMVEVIYNATSEKAKEYENCCRPLHQDPDWDTKRPLEKRILTSPINKFTSTTERADPGQCYCDGFQSIRCQWRKDLSKISIPMPRCLSRKPEERFVPDMMFKTRSLGKII